MQSKRDPNNAGAEARRASLHEQTVGKPGFVGQMWHKYVNSNPNSPICIQSERKEKWCGIG